MGSSSADFSSSLDGCRAFGLPGLLLSLPGFHWRSPTGGLNSAWRSFSYSFLLSSSPPAESPLLGCFGNEPKSRPDMSDAIQNLASIDRIIHEPARLMIV